MKEYSVFFRIFMARLKGSVVSHVYVFASSKEDALKEAGKLVHESATLIRADECPTWEVTKA